jgi:hypothetical protein
VVKNTDNWLDIIAIRRILLSKSEMIRQMLSFSKWTLNKGYTFISKMIFDADDRDHQKNLQKVGQSSRVLDLAPETQIKIENIKTETDTHLPFLTLQSNQSTI